MALEQTRNHKQFGGSTRFYTHDSKVCGVKMTFSAFVPEVKERLTGRSSVLVTGMETHVCVFQTVRALGDAKLTAYLAADAVLSRTECTSS